MRDLRVSLPAPCDEPWEAMAPRGCNRLCATCDTVVHDLSALTVDQADALLDSDEHVCVRATVAADGSIRTATPPGQPSRRMVATIGAGVFLATAACQTTALAPVSPRYEITGRVTPGSFARTARLWSAGGGDRSITIRGDRQFRFTNLPAGTYSLSFIDGCGEQSPGSRIVLTDDLNMGAVDVNAENFCIIVGMMQRRDDSGR